MTDWDPDFESYYEQVMYDEGLLAPYEEEYSRRPIPDEKVWSVAGFVHHPQCEYVEGQPELCNCKSLYERDYHEEREQELEAMHEEWWQ